MVRLKVEHSGFDTLNIQRFGSKFVKDARPFRFRDDAVDCKIPGTLLP